jgi:hypothetical protein
MQSLSSLRSWRAAIDPLPDSFATQQWPADPFATQQWPAPAPASPRGTGSARRGGALGSWVLGSWRSLQSPQSPQARGASRGKALPSGTSSGGTASERSPSETTTRARVSRSSARGDAADGEAGCELAARPLALPCPTALPRPSSTDAFESKVVPMSEVTLCEVIGRGAFGAVHAAEYSHTRCALKRLRAEDGAGGQQGASAGGLIEGLKAEFDVMLLLRHPHVLQVGSRHPASACAPGRKLPPV